MQFQRQFFDHILKEINNFPLHEIKIQGNRQEITAHYLCLRMGLGALSALTPAYMEA